MAEQIKMRCAWEGHPVWESTCLGVASCFLRTAKGTIWALCNTCSEYHKVRSIRSVSEGSLPADRVVNAKFDIPLDDPETFAAYKQQDRIGPILDNARKLWETLRPPTPSRT